MKAKKKKRIHHRTCRTGRLQSTRGGGATLTKINKQNVQYIILT